MWAWKLFIVTAELFFFMLIESEAYTCTCRYCYHCTGCSATACSKNGRFLSLLDYLEAYGQEVERHLEVTSPVIPCTVPNALCDYPHNKYCCDGATMTCGLGEQWPTCVSGSTLIDDVITPIYTKSLCDFDFPCTGKGGNECCGGLDLYNGEGPGTCSTAYCTSTPLVACNYVGNAALQYKTPDFDASVTVNGIMPAQVNNKYCGENNISNRNSGRCRSSNLCCSPLGLCNVDTASCATKSISWAWMAGSINDWVQTGGAADSVTPCGNGTIGNGRCETNDATYGVTCCSDAGFCGSEFCNGASGNVYECDCVNGIPGSGTRGCTTCASCNEGYYLSSSNSNTCAPIVLGNFKCPSGTFVTSMDFWLDHGTGFITGVDFFHCSDGSSVNVNKGQDTGAPASVARVSGFCGGRVSWVYKPFGTNNQLLTELTFAFCDGGTVTYGGPMSDHGEATYDFQSGKQLTGMKAATCQNGSVNNVCFLTFTFTSVPIVAAPTAAPSSQPTGQVTLDGRCGKSHNGYICWEASCCSRYGWCGGYYLSGPSDPYCGAGCQAAYSPNGCYTECYCSNGVAATGSNCPYNSATKCASCNTGYSLSSGLCVEITCYCSNGVAVKYPDCVYNGASKCASCDAGYYLSSDMCAGNGCVCSHGYGAVGQDCPNNGAPKCASCYAGYHLSSDDTCAAGHTLVIRKADCSPGTNILYLTEVTIIDAFNQVATLSSTYSSFFVASKCIDGSTSTGCAGSGVGGVDTLTITFTGTASSIVVTNRPSGAQWQIVGVTMTLDGSLIYTFPSPGTSVYTVTVVPFFTPAPTPAPTASGSPTAVPSTPKPTFLPSSASPTTVKPTSTVSPTTPKPSTTSPTKTPKPSTATPATPMPATVKPSTVSPTTPKPSTPVPSTASPTKTPKPSTVSPTTVKPSTASPTTPKPSTPVPTTVKPSTLAPTTAQDAPTPKPTFVPSTTSPSKTPKPSTLGPTTTPIPSTVSPTKTPKPSTASPTTLKPSTASPTTPKPSTPVPTTAKPTTLAPPAQVTPSSPPTFVPSTTSPTKTPKPPSTVSPTTPLPSTVEPSTAPTTPVPSTANPTKTPKPSTANPTTIKPSTANPSTVQPSTLAPTPAQVAASYVCSTGFVIDSITLRSDTGLNAISSYNCKDSSGNFKTKTVGVGDSSAGTSVTVTGPFSAFSSGFAVSPDPADAASGLSFVRTDGSKVPKSSLPPYGTSSTGVTTQSCSSGQVLYGFSLVTDSSGTMVGGSMTARCRDALTAAPSPAPT